MPSNYALMPLVERALLAEAEEERASQGSRSEMDSARCYELAVKHVEEMAKYLEPLVLEKDDTEDRCQEEDSVSGLGSHRQPSASRHPRCMLSQQMQKKV